MKNKNTSRFSQRYTWLIAVLHVTLVKIRHSLPHSDAADADAGVRSRVTRVQDADAQAFEGPVDAARHLAVLALPGTLKGFPGEVFAKNDPRRILVADFVVGADELPFGGAAPVALGTTSAIVTGPERDASGQDGRLEFVPNEMGKWDRLAPFAISVSSRVEKDVVIALKGIFHSITVGPSGAVL